MSLRRSPPKEFKRRLDSADPRMLLDVRRSGALIRNPQGIAGAIPILLDESDPKIPDIPRDTEMLVYCLCSGQASSTRVANWLLRAGYQNVAVLEGGLPAWEATGLPLAEISIAERDQVGRWLSSGALAELEHHPGRGALMVESAFLAGQSLPVRREMAVLFVDMVDSTELLFKRTPEQVLSLVQTFMAVVVEIAIQHCGDVHDFEGDGAMLYFAGAGEAVPAAFSLREALAAKRLEIPDLPEARFALDNGPLIAGYVGGRERRSLSFIGPSINTASRILKLAPPGGIVATETIVAHSRRADPDLASQFDALPERQVLKGFADPVAVYVARAGTKRCNQCE